MTILASYSEIALKGKYVRRKLERELGGHIKIMLKKGGYPEPEIELKFGRIYVDGVPPEAADLVAKTFGVVRAMPATRIDTDLESVLEQVVEEAREVLKHGESFAVRPKVVGNHPYGSRDIAIEAGSRVLEALADKDIYVNLDKPDQTLYVEVRDQDAFVYSRMISGVKGLPYSTQGRMVSLFSGGIDSPVSTWLMMKRGGEVLPLFMDQTPYVGKSYLERALNSFNVINGFVPKEKFTLYSAPMGHIMDKILEAEDQKYSCIMCKRSMYRIASYFAQEKKAKGIITGESLGQVASQTLENLYVIDRVVEMMVIRPLIGLDKVEIEEIARDIGTYNITAKSVEGCTAVPPHPATRSNLVIIEELEEKLSLDALCRKAAEEITVVNKA